MTSCIICSEHAAAAAEAGLTPEEARRIVAIGSRAALDKGAWSNVQNGRMNAKASTRNRGGRPALTIDLEMVKAYSSKGLSQGDAADLLKISLSTFKSRLANDAAFREAWENGIAASRATLKTLQWRHASGRGRAAVAMVVHMSKHMLGETDKSVVEHANKEGTQGEFAERPTQFMDVILATASPEELAALEVLAIGAERRAAAAARNIADEVIKT